MTPLLPADHAATAERLRRAGCVFAEDEANILIGSAATSRHLESMILQRVDGLPIEHVAGWAAFADLRVVVAFGVFVPRRRSEFLVATACKVTVSGDVVLDLCCGSGAVGIAIAAKVDVELIAADVEPAAVRCARLNVEPIGGAVYEGDLYDALPSEWRGRIGVIVCNAPYVPVAEIDVLPREARLHEPLVTLAGGADGLDVQRRVIAAANQWLAPGGHLLIETSARQASRTAALVSAGGMSVEVVYDDDLDATVVIGTLRDQ